MHFIIIFTILFKVWSELYMCIRGQVLYENTSTSEREQRKTRSPRRAQNKFNSLHSSIHVIRTVKPIIREAGRERNKNCIQKLGDAISQSKQRLMWTTGNYGAISAGEKKYFLRKIMYTVCAAFH
jgi:beta-lactamase class D